MNYYINCWIEIFYMKTMEIIFFNYQVQMNKKFWFFKIHYLKLFGVSLFGILNFFENFPWKLHIVSSMVKKLFGYQ